MKITDNQITSEHLILFFFDMFCNDVCVTEPLLPLMSDALWLLLCILSPWGKQCGDLILDITRSFYLLHIMSFAAEIMFVVIDKTRQHHILHLLFLFIDKIMAICTNLTKAEYVLPTGFSLLEPLHQKKSKKP